MSSGRRDFLKGLTGAVGSLTALGCGGGAAARPTAEAHQPESSSGAEGTHGGEPSAAAHAGAHSANPTAPAMAVPRSRPADWDAVAFNRDRGNAGAIPDSYLPKVNGEDGESAHLGKHLPYVPGEVTVADGKLALMWGDPTKGHVRHPQAVPSANNNNEGHWYNWIRVRKAVDAPADEAETRFSAWPEAAADDSGAYAVQGGGDITEDSGKNTVYVVALPPDVGPGDWVRIYAHCLTHGEYVDFLRLPEGIRLA